VRDAPRPIFHASSCFEQDAQELMREPTWFDKCSTKATPRAQRGASGTRGQAAVTFGLQSVETDSEAGVLTQATASMHSPEHVVTEAFRRAEEYHTPLNLPLPVFMARVCELASQYQCPLEHGALKAFLKRIHTNDLYLAIACSHGSADAWFRFVSLYTCTIYSQAFYVSRNRDDAVETTSAVIENILTPSADGRHRLRSFEGRSSLATWLRVVVRNALETARRARLNAVELSSVFDIADESGVAKVESWVLSGRYYDAASAALSQACDALPPRFRRVLLMRYEQGLALADIARLLHIHESTVIRNIQDAQLIVRLSTRKALQKRGLSTQAISECIHDLVCNPRYSLLATLTSAGGDNSDVAEACGLHVSNH
jgi:RNA polymerase sigma-70 factor (ECF subfamily)